MRRRNLAIVTGVVVLAIVAALATTGLRQLWQWFLDLHGAH